MVSNCLRCWYHRILVDSCGLCTLHCSESSIIRTRFVHRIPWAVLQALGEKLLFFFREISKQILLRLLLVSTRIMTNDDHIIVTIVCSQSQAGLHHTHYAHGFKLKHSAQSGVTTQTDHCCTQVPLGGTEETSLLVKDADEKLFTFFTPSSITS